jgi:hypothetical protein
MTSSDKAAARPPRWVALLLVSLAGLLLEVGYTRVISFKLWYYYTYLVIGLSLLGIGSGGILVAVWGGLKRASTERIIAVASIAGAVGVALGFVTVAHLPINTYDIWDYGSVASFSNLVGLGIICLALSPPSWPSGSWWPRCWGGAATRWAGCTSPTSWEREWDACSPCR